MPARAEIGYRPQPTGNILERGLKAAARSRVGRVIAVGTIAFGADACAPQAREPQAIGTVVVMEPGAMATVRAGEAQIAATAFADRATATAQAQQPKPVETATATGQGGGKPEETSVKAPAAPEIPVVSDIPAQLDSLLSSVEAISKPFNPNASLDEQKRDVKASGQEVKDAFTKGDIEEARKRLVQLRATIRGLGDQSKNRFIPKEIRDKYDPQGLVLKPTDIADPAVLDLYLAVVRLQLNPTSSNSRL